MSRIPESSSQSPSQPLSAAEGVCVSMAEVADELAEAGSAAGGAVRRAMHEAGEMASEYAQQGRTVVTHCIAASRHSIRQRPFTAVITAAGCGLAAGLLIRRWMVSKE